MFPKNEDIAFVLAYMNSKVSELILNIINPTLNYGAGSVAQVPMIKERIIDVSKLSESNISISRSDWDSFETSWDFKRHPLVPCAKNEQGEFPVLLIPNGEF